MTDGAQMMSGWLINDLLKGVKTDPFWEGYLGQLNTGGPLPFSIHLAVMVEPYLRFILDGSKTVESRFSVHRIAPYERVEIGDVILLKRTGGPIVGICQVSQRWFYKLDPHSWQTIKQNFTQALCAQDPSFWKQRKSASFATLMRVKHVRSISPITISKRDRRGWVIVHSSESELPLWSRGASNTVVIGFSGAIGSGKSTVSKGVADVLGAPRASFGDYVRSVAQQRGLKKSREVLQDIGESLVREDLEAFCKAVIAQSGWNGNGPLVIEGIRHLKVANALRHMISPVRFLLVFINADEQVREVRLQQRAYNKGESLRQADSHSTEKDVHTLIPKMADVIVDGTRPVDALVKEILEIAKPTYNLNEKLSDSRM